MVSLGQAMHALLVGRLVVVAHGLYLARHLFTLCIYMTYKLIQCIEITQNAQILKIADFADIILAPDLIKYQK